MKAMEGPKEVSIKAIEDEIGQLWKGMADLQARETGHALIRARALNLMVYSPGEEEADSIAELIARIAVQHPCRAIVMIAASREAKSDLQAWVSAYCLPPVGSAGHICCEQIAIRAKRDAHEKLPSIIAPLLVRDLPVFLWWRGAAFKSELFGRLAGISDRIIIDSADFENPTADLSELANSIASRYRSAAFSDLAWARLTSWRQLAAQLFDSPTFRPYLYRLGKVIIEYGSNSRDRRAIPTEALLAAGWLASRLKWQLAATGHMPKNQRDQSAPGSLVLNMISGARPIAIELRAVASSAALNGRLASLKLIAEEDSPALFAVSRGEDPACIEASAEVAGMSPIRRIMCWEDESLAQMISKELEIIGQDAVYEQALKMAGTFAEEA